MFDKLHELFQKGYRPDTILDIGAHHGTWTEKVKTMVPNANYYLFEAIPYIQLDKFKSESNVQVFTTILNETNTEVDWYELQNTGDSFFKERTHFFKDCKPCKKQSYTLDTLNQTHSLFNTSKSIFIKIDCQGAEIPILKGATSILEKTDFILLEMPFFGQYNEGVPTFLEHIQYMDSIGFTPYDILDTHSIKTFTMQVDILFINKNHPFTQLVQEIIV